MDLDIANELAAIQSSVLDDHAKVKGTYYTQLTTHVPQLLPLDAEHHHDTQHAVHLADVTVSHTALNLSAHEQTSGIISDAPATYSSAVQAVTMTESELAAGGACLLEEFDDSKVWCTDCGCDVEDGCKTHPVRAIADKAIPSLARLTLPPCFILSAAGGSGGSGVVCKKLVKARTRFGPLIGKRLDDLSAGGGAAESCVFKVFTGRASFYYLDTSDERSSNWMMFVRRAETPAQQNVVAYQSKGSIYFLTTKRLMPGDELRVAFSDSYAELAGANIYTRDSAKEATKEKSVIMKDGYPCDTCDEEFSHFEELQQHSCPADTETAARETKRPRNRRKGRPQKLGSQPDKPSSQLSSVRKDRKAKRLNTKTKGYRSVQVVKCSSCESVFNTRRRLEIHMHVHTGEYPYKCQESQCNKSFNTKFKLDRHKLTHGSRDFTCAQCGKGFSRRDNLQAHLIVHDDNREVHRCVYEACSKQYNCLSSFRVHIALHQVDESQTSVCPLCQQVYGDRDKLTRHIKLHAGSKTARDPLEKKYECDVCRKSFYANKDRQRHMLTHTKEKRFECDMCNLKFGRADHLKRHLARVHVEGGGGRELRARSRTKKCDALAELTSAELTKSIQQLLADNSLDPTTSTLLLPEGCQGGSSVQITPYAASGQRTAHYEVVPCSVAGGQRVGGGQMDASYSHYLKPAAGSGWSSVDAIKLGQPTMILLPEGQHPITSIDQLQKPSGSGGLLDGGHMLPADNLCVEYAGDSFKVFHNYTPILLNGDSNSADADFLPAMYQSNINPVVSTNQ